MLSVSGNDTDWIGYKEHHYERFILHFSKKPNRIQFFVPPIIFLFKSPKIKGNVSKINVASAKCK